MYDQKEVEKVKPWRTKEFLQEPVRFKHIEDLLNAVADPLRERIRQLERATGVGVDKDARPGVEMVAPVVRNFVESRLAPLEALVREHEDACMRFSGVYKQKTYKRGQAVSFRGGLWLCLACTDTKPGTGDWKLVVKSGAFGPRDDGTRKNTDDDE